MRRAAVVVLACVVAVLGPAGCASYGDSASSPGGDPSVGRPVSGTCHTYGAAAADAPTDVSGPVSCAKPHTGQTVAVTDGLGDPGEDGSWTAEELDLAGRLSCGPQRLASEVGMSTNDLAATRLVQAFFGPTPEQAKQGARWVRCDAYVHDGEDPVLVSGRLVDLVKTPGAFAACTATPPPDELAAVRCRDGKALRAAVGTATAASSTARTPAALRADCARAWATAVVRDRSAAKWIATPLDETTGTYLCWLPFADWNVDATTWPVEKPVTSTDAG